MQVESKETVAADKSVEELEKEFLLLLQGEDTQPTHPLGTAVGTGDAGADLTPDHVHLGAAADTMIKVRERETESEENIRIALADAAVAKERLVFLPGPYMIRVEDYRAKAIENWHKAEELATEAKRKLKACQLEQKLGKIDQDIASGNTQLGYAKRATAALKQLKVINTHFSQNSKT